MHLESKPNFTAWFVMQGTIAAMRQSDFKAVMDEATLALYQPLSDAASKTRFISRLIHSLPYAWQYWIGGLVTHPDRLRHFCFRKKEIEKQTRKLLEEGGMQQIIVLGAGLDVLSMRLAKEYPAVKFIEIDTKESQDFKASSFQAHQVPLPDNVEFLRGDLREPLPGILNHSMLHNTGAKTLWIAEGFFMFIPQDGVIKLLKEIRECSAIGSHMIFTSLPSHKPASLFRYMLQMFYLRKEESPYQWTIAFDDVPLFIENLGYERVLQIDYGSLQESTQQRKLAPADDMIENIHIARI
jgi:methyltransferase (TIGR00027 family)